MAKESLSVKAGGDSSLVINGLRAGANEAVGGSWTARELRSGRVLLSKETADSQKHEQASSWAQLSCEALAFLLQGYCQSAWTGALVIDTGFGVKRLFFKNGEVVFAASSAIDDRLGEVIYRDGLISLDAYTRSAAKVTRAVRFGQVLISSGIFTSLDLWQALCLQVRGIVRSVFMAETLYVEAHNGLLPRTELALQEGTQAFLESSFAFGAMFRNFVSGLKKDTQIKLANLEDEIKPIFPQGTFHGDFLSLS